MTRVGSQQERKKKLKIRKRSVVAIRGLSFTAAPITEDLSHSRPASAGRSRYSCVARDGAQGTDRRNERDLPGRKEA
jgi:hypothetical protein